MQRWGQNAKGAVKTQRPPLKRKGRWGKNAKMISITVSKAVSEKCYSEDVITMDELTKDEREEVVYAIIKEQEEKMKTLHEENIALQRQNLIHLLAMCALAAFVAVTMII